jgi:hypothetical protein
MAALAPVLLGTINNPVECFTTSATIASDVTYAPEGWKPGNVASWVNRAGGIPLGYPRLTFSLRAPTKESRVYKVSSKLFLPVLETIDPAVGIFGPKLAYELQMHCDFLIPERATSAERLLFLSLARGLFFANITASDGSPTSVVAGPLVNGVTLLEDVY